MKEIGKSAIDGNLTQTIFLENICLNLPSNISEKDKLFKQHAIILDFNTKDKFIYITFEEIDDTSSKKYLYIGNSKGNKPQINITTNNVKYLFSNTLPLLKARAQGKFAADINGILNDFFNKKTIEVKGKIFEYHYIKPEVFVFPNNILGNLKEIENEVNKASTKKDIENKIKEFTANLESAFTISINSLLKEEISIYTVSIDDKLVCQMDEYKKIIFDEKISALFQRSNKRYQTYYQFNSICSVCGSRDETTSNSTNLEFKFYNNDNIGFSSNLDEKFTKNYNICKNCYQLLMISEIFIGANLKSRIGGLNCYIIPNFVQKRKDFNFLDFSEDIKETTHSIVNLESVEKSINKVQRINRESRNNFTVNYLFYVPSSKNDFKILKLMKDVSPSRIEIIRSNLNEISNLIESKYENNPKLKLDLNRIWSCIPIKVKKGTSGKYEGTSRYLSLLDSIFSDTRIQNQTLISQFNEITQIIKFERPSYNIEFSDKSSFTNKVLQLNFLLLFLRNLNLLEESHMINETEIDVSLVQDMLPKQILHYWKDVKIYDDNQKKSLFLLGYMMGEIGRWQSSQDIKNKPILNKITFQGMSTEKLIRLANEVFEKLKQYRILISNEKINSAFRILFESDIKQWTLSNQENVFYVLSGYSYWTYSNYISWNMYKKNTEELFKAKLEAVNKLKDKKVNVESHEKLLSEVKKLIYGEIKDYKKAKEILTEISIDE